MIIPAIINVWTSPGSEIAFLELCIKNRFIVLVYAHGKVWNVESISGKVEF